MGAAAGPEMPRDDARPATGASCGPVARWVCGGQTGVDRALLDAARDCGAECGGWCPAGGAAEDRPVPPGVLADHPGLKPTPSAEPAQRTCWNVRDSDVTLLLPVRSMQSPGTLLTVQEAARLGRPLLTHRLDEPVPGYPPSPGGRPDVVVAWLVRQAELVGRPIVVNVAGPRESECPGVYAAAHGFLASLLSACRLARWATPTSGSGAGQPQA